MSSTPCLGSRLFLANCPRTSRRSSRLMFDMAYQSFLAWPCTERVQCRCRGRRPHRGHFSADPRASLAPLSTPVPPGSAATTAARSTAGERLPLHRRHYHQRRHHCRRVLRRHQLSVPPPAPPYAPDPPRPADPASDPCRPYFLLPPLPAAPLLPPLSCRRSATVRISPRLPRANAAATLSHPHRRPPEPPASLQLPLFCRC